MTQMRIFNNMYEIECLRESEDEKIVNWVKGVWKKV